MEKLDDHSILLKIYEEQQEIKKQLRIIPEVQEQLEAIPEMQEQLKTIQLKELPEIQEEIRKISKTVARIEVEHGQKLDILFDAFTTLSEKLDSHEKRITSCEKKLENQDHEIYYLKSKVQGL